MRRELIVTAVLLTIASGIAQEIDLNEVKDEIDFFGAKAGILDSGTSTSDQMIFFGFFGGGFIAILVIIAFVGLIFYKYKYSSKEGGAVSEQELFKKYNY